MSVIEEPKRKGNPRWQPGVSGNPKGATPGKGKRLMRFREQIEDALPDVIAVLIADALNPTSATKTQSARLLIERGVPSYRSEAPTIVLPAVTAADTLTNKGRAVFDAAANGEVSPTSAGEMLGGLAGIARLQEIDEQQSMIDELTNRVTDGGLP
jgi:hypothetical protein